MRLFIQIVVPFVLAASPCLGASLDDQLKQRQAELVKIKNLVDPKAAPLLQQYDLRLWLSRNMLEAIPHSYNSQPYKTFKYQATGSEGDIVADDPDIPGCGSYHISLSHTDLQASLDLPSITLHYLGAFLRSRARYHLFSAGTVHFKITCGFTIADDLEFKSWKDGELAADITLSSTEANTLVYTVSNLVPETFQLTANVAPEELPRALAIPVSFSFDIPKGGLTKGVIPNLFRGEGDISLASPVEFRRRYLFSIRNITPRSDSNGYAMQANAAIQWR